MLKEKLYGDKDSKEFDTAKIREQFAIIADTKKSVDAAKKLEKDTLKPINDMISKVEKDYKVADADLTKKATDMKDEEIKNKGNALKVLDHKVNVWRAYCNDITVFFGAYVKALTDKNRQAKAVCVKALSYKHEAATVAEGAYNDIFAGVEII